MKLYLHIFLISLLTNAQGMSQTTGPEKGHLVVVGGAMTSQEIIDTFVDLAGGLDAPIVVIPTAAGASKYPEHVGLAGRLKTMGATNVTVLHTNDRTEADSEHFIKPLKQAKGVWFGGGRQWRLVDAYAGTRTEKAIKNVLDRGGVVGGSSAGATIQGSFLARGDTKTNQIMMGDHQEGFSYIKNVAIDQHVLARNRQFDLYEIMAAHPHLLGLGIDENTALVVSGNTFKVIGESYVLVYDGNFWSREGSQLKQLPEREQLFYMLKAGDAYNMLERKVVNSN